MSHKKIASILDRVFPPLIILLLTYKGGFTFQAIESPHDCESQKKEFNISYRINLSIEKFRGMY